MDKNPDLYDTVLASFELAYLSTQTDATAPFPDHGYYNAEPPPAYSQIVSQHGGPVVTQPHNPLAYGVGAVSSPGNAQMNIYVDPRADQFMGAYGGRQFEKILQPGLAGVPGGRSVPEVWMPKPQTAPNCPPGLEYLTLVNTLLIRQWLNVADMITQNVKHVKFLVLNAEGQQIYRVREKEIPFSRICWANREYTLHIEDNVGMEVMRLHRDEMCLTCNICPCACSDCCKRAVAVEVPVGNVIGYIQQRCGGDTNRHVIMNADQKCLMEFDATACSCCSTGYSNMSVEIRSTQNNSHVANIRHEWNGREMIPNTIGFASFFDNYEISFLDNLEPSEKALLIAANLFMHFIYFERIKLTQQQRQR